MRSMKLICAFLAAYSASTLAVSSDLIVLGERALREECSAFSQAGMRNCLAKKADGSQKALRQAEEKVASILSKWDEDNKYVNQAKVKFVSSNKNFAKYRDAHCAFASSLGGGAIGTALDMRRFACVTELNNRRAEQLRDAVSDLPSK